MPIAVIDTVADGAPLYHVITDHLYRPIAMYDSTGTQVWSAVWEPFGALHSVSGALALDARFPGQWYQLETGLHYNWHRHYDPTLGRYTQPDPLGLEAGANRFTYALGNPIMNIDPDGQFILPMIAGGLIAGGIDAAAQYLLTGCIDLWQVGAAAAAGAVGGGAFANAFKHSSKAVSWWNSAQNYKAVSKRVRRVRDLTGDQELHHWFFPNNGWGSSVPNWIKNHPANLHTMETASHIALHNGKLGILGSLNYGLPGWLASTIGFAGGNGLGNALKPDCACKN
jgi:RHS repeat-associated protein